MVFDPFISLIICTGFALMFALAGVHKMRDLTTFKDIVSGYNVVPSVMIGLVGIVLPLLELSIAIMLLWLPKIGIIMAGGLLSVYALMMAFNIMRGHTHIDCGCFWGGSNASFTSLTWMQVLRNCFLISLMMIVFIPKTGRVLSLVDFLNLAIAIGFGFVAIHAANTLITSYQRMRDYGHV